MHFVIAGSINCAQFTYAVMVAQRLKENLPDFSYLKLAMKPDLYKTWLIKTCQENQWYHIQSPIIWREFGLKKGKKDFIGDINKFLDLCYDYYGIPQEILSGEQFNKQEIDWFTQRTESEYFEHVKVDAKERREYRSRQVCITGASSQITEIIIMELLQNELQRRENGLEIRLFDDPTKEKKLHAMSIDAKCSPGISGFGNCRVAKTLQEALFNIDLVIVLDAFTRRTNETLVRWLKRNRNAMCALGKALNKYAPPHCRVILGGPSSQPLCYNATVLSSFATNLHVRNIVAVTQDLGRQILKLLSVKTKIPLKEFFCPPVWGFVGLNKFIDVRKTLRTHLYTVPGEHFKSTLPQGREEYHLRTCESLLDEEGAGDLQRQVAGQRAEIFPQLGRWPFLAKATAILDLLKVWGVKQEDGKGEILCLGVYSDGKPRRFLNGTFNIPHGIYWSQPVVLVNGFWVPFAEFPIPRSPGLNIYNLFMFSVAALYRTKIKPRIYIPPKRKAKPKSKEREKFDFWKIAETIGMPAIRTDPECVAYLKHLTKTELGIDLDEEKYCIEEEEEEEPKQEIAPPEEVVPKQVFCECWRQELKELQKIVFDHPSTTEVEVDLSENVSGSEWSVIEATSKTSIIPEVEQSAGRKKHHKYRTGDTKPEQGRTDGRRQDSGDQQDSKSVSTGSTACSCGTLPTGSVCKCLAPASSSRASPEEEKKEEEKPAEEEEEKVTTEHFYKEQNAEIFEEDLKDVIYEDTFTGEKHTSFSGNTKEEDGTVSQLTFYGKKDAVKDPKVVLKMQKRISRYECGGEVSSVEDVQDEKSEAGETVSVSEEFGESKKSFQLSGEDKEGTEYVKEKSTSSKKKSPATTDGKISSTPTFISDSEKSEKSFSLSGEEPSSVSETLYPPQPAEKSAEEYSAKSLDEELYATWGESRPYGLFDKEEEEEKPQKKKKREGIPLCCLCRCLLPEGSLVCPCGETTVVEVFKKESIEIFIQNEDDMEFMVEYFEKNTTSTSTTALESEDFLQSAGFMGQSNYERPMGGDVDDGDDFAVGLGKIKGHKLKALPPESFFPFHPKPENKFKETIRPFELTKEYVNSFEKKENEIPPKCAELMDLAKRELEESSFAGEEGEEFDYLYPDTERSLPTVCEDVEQIKTDFSDLKMFVPCGLEDWRVTVQKKYREWFFKGPKIKDETYYDVVMEDVSEDEFELDAELEKYFET